MLKADEIYAWVRDLPVIDWHNHLDMQMLADDKPLGSLYEVWVKADPYKHRAMRICGVPERLITGGGNGQDARCPRGGTGPCQVGHQTGTTGVPPVDERAKWDAWMQTLPKLVGNPIFAWAKMELEFLGLDPVPYLQGRGENVSLSEWTPSKLLSAFNVEWMSPCVGAAQLGVVTATGETPVVPAGGTNATGETPVVPEKAVVRENGGLGQRASRPLQWTPPFLRIFSSPGDDVSDHFSHTLTSGLSHRRNLPHIAQSSTLVFVTFRLGDSLPESQLAELEEMRRLSKGKDLQPSEMRAWHEKIDAWLDAGHGSCVLADTKCRKIVEDAFAFFDEAGRDGQDARCPSEAVGRNGQDARCPSRNDGAAGTTGVSPVARAVRPRYRLHAYVVMPNHVHVLLELFNAKDLPGILHSWKSFTAKAINQELGTSGALWHAEYYDRLIRDGEHYQNVLAYLRKNAAAAEKIALIRAAGRNGQDARCPSEVGGRNGQDARCPSVGLGSCKGGRQTGTTGVPPVAVAIRPSLRMNAGDQVPIEQLERFRAEGCRVIDISVDDTALLETAFDSLATVAAFAARHGWTMLLHLGALRETSVRLKAAAGSAGGFAGMRGAVDPAAVARFLDRLERGNGQDARCPSGGMDPCKDGRLTGTTGVSPVAPGRLPRIVLLSLNPEAHAQLAVLAGSFVEDGVPGKVQLGPAWWWCDHREGIFDVFEKNAAYGVLSTFIGMTTDSRSLLSFVRHDYFRRLFARWLAQKVADGDFPDDAALLRPLAENVCYRNAKERFVR